MLFSQLIPLFYFIIVISLYFSTSQSSESISKAYDRKCVQLRHQFARDLDARVIDKTRAVAKVLHSRLRVAIQTVDSISRRIERLRDEELQPQLIELIQGYVCYFTFYLMIHLSNGMHAMGNVSATTNFLVFLSKLIPINAAFICCLIISASEDKFPLNSMQIQ